MKEALDFLKRCGTFFIATDENGQPRVRPFGAVTEFDGKLYIITNNQKEVYKQLKKNPKTEICGFDGEKWIRISGTLEEDLRKEARVAMLETDPSLKKLYSADDGLMTVFFFKTGKAVISSFTDAPVTYEL